MNGPSLDDAGYNSSGRLLIERAPFPFFRKLDNAVNLWTCLASRLALNR